jgi:hypothetical protein
MKKIIHLTFLIILFAAALVVASWQPARADSAVVGTGTPASCTEAALDAALAELYPGANAPGGVLSFNCGPNLHTIVVTSEKFLYDGTVIDGGGLITLSGGNTTRIFFVSQQARVEIHHITLTKGFAAGGGAIFVEPNFSGDYTSLLLNDVTLRANYSSSFGGAIGAQHTALAVTNSLLVDNISDWGGGAISLNGGIFTMSASRVVGNSAKLAGSTGGGLDIYGSTLDIQTSTLRENWATLSAGGAIALSNSTGTIANSQIEQNSASTLGAGIYQTDSDLTLTQVTITNNTANYGGGIANNSSLLALNGATALTNNKATLGGGLYNFDGAVSAQNARLLNNQAVGGGGIYNAVGSLALWDVTLDGNSAKLGGISATLGGGLYNSGSASLTRVTMTKNTSEDYGGAIYNASGRTAILTEVTLSENSAESGGGIFNDGSLSLLNVTITKNTALNSGGGLVNNNGSSTALVMINTLFALNTANILNSDQCMLYKAPGTQVFSLWSGLSCGSSIANGNHPNTIAPLAPLGFTGTGLPSELTMTHMPLPGSPAEDAGTCEYGTLSHDQRGVARPYGSTCDIGAVEMASFVHTLYLPMVVR